MTQLAAREIEMPTSFAGRALRSAKRNTALWMRQGIAPQRLALTLALGFAIGCIPLVGTTTLLCAALALALRLNLPAIQAANYVAMPFQLALILPFVRLGRWLLPASFGRGIGAASLQHGPALAAASQIGGMATQAMLAWAVLAVPAVALISAVLTPVLRRVPILAERSEEG